ncbi:MAG: SulP family inorganic anion transporter [Gemmataceae bacterium]
MINPHSVFRDLSAGVVVFLVALPLCLGVAVASGAPPFAGLIAGIVGGIVVGLLSGSHTSVSGPAAGLTAVVAYQITVLGDYSSFTTVAVVLAGTMQIALGAARAVHLELLPHERDQGPARRHRHHHHPEADSALARPRLRPGGR